MAGGGTDDRPYRPCVGVMLLNTAGQVFVGNRIDVPGDHWQMPQGGIDHGESPAEAAFREVQEETGIAPEKVRLIRESDRWLHYDLPAGLSRRIWKGRYRGQKQRWFAMRFQGVDSDIDLDFHTPEFGAYRWVAIADLPDLIVPFKRDTYEQVVSEFKDVALPGD
ncbi:RNA pyrophosphohydrolase [Hwanghaeella grinnelliae]|uniref:RNA pyrophosphohydrolase n=1 Tax=Hwanghaeella grinnelliae TaxID=2500179 RepID=A0A3S2W9Q6_9PROT|nr:RNA pyrophosphohydrolase [Hwanghaeella grinnelliae]RVU36677.1 RNA pyrophosphohydrolase [Hwanghaeella grinnelliae]